MHCSRTHLPVLLHLLICFSQCARAEFRYNFISAGDDDSLATLVLGSLDTAPSSLISLELTDEGQERLYFQDKELLSPGASVSGSGDTLVDIDGLLYSGPATAGFPAELELFDPPPIDVFGDQFSLASVLFLFPVNDPGTGFSSAEILLLSPDAPGGEFDRALGQWVKAVPEPRCALLLVLAIPAFIACRFARTQQARFPFLLVIANLTVSSNLTTPCLAQFPRIPPNLSAGDEYRIVFLSSALTSPFIPDAGYYNQLVTDVASNSALSFYEPWNDEWYAIVSTETIDARDNVGIPIITPEGFEYYDLPIYLANGLQVATGNEDLWDGEIMNPINLTEQGTPLASPNNVWTGTSDDGTAGVDVTAFPFEVPAAMGSSGNIVVGSSLETDDWVFNSYGSGTFEGPSDRHIYGISSVLTVPLPTVHGDFDNDDDVDGADFLQWQSTFGSTTILDADANGDSIVNDADLVVWRDHYGDGFSITAVSSVPEPSSAMLIALSVAATATSSRRRLNSS